MISSDSIQYMVRKQIKDTERPLTVFELRDFLDRLIMGGCGDYKIQKPVTHYVLDGHDNTVLLD